MVTTKFIIFFGFIVFMWILIIREGHTNSKKSLVGGDKEERRLKKLEKKIERTGRMMQKMHQENEIDKKSQTYISKPVEKSNLHRAGF